MAPILAGSVAGAIVYAYSRDPDMGVDLLAIRTAIYEFTLSPDLSPGALQAMLIGLPIKELKTPEAQLLIAPILATYKAYGEEYVRQGLDRNAGLKILLQSMLDGLDEGLAAVNAMRGMRTTAVEVPRTELLRVVFEALDNELQLQHAPRDLAMRW